MPIFMTHKVVAVLEKVLSPKQSKFYQKGLYFFFQKQLLLI